MAQSLKIVSREDQVRIILDDHEIKGVTEYRLEETAKGPVMLTITVAVMGETEVQR